MEELEFCLEVKSSPRFQHRTRVTDKLQPVVTTNIANYSIELLFRSTSPFIWC